MENPLNLGDPVAVANLVEHISHRKWVAAAGQQTIPGDMLEANLECPSHYDNTTTTKSCARASAVVAKLMPAKCWK